MTGREIIEPGIYFGMPEARYFAADGLSNSGMKRLAMSPLHYWHDNLNPDHEPDEETSAQRWGKAVHCRLLEPEHFADAYAAKLDPADFPDALVTTEDLQDWLKSHDMPHSGKRKQDLIDRITTSGLPAVIWDVEKERHTATHEGKVMLSADEASTLERLADVVFSDPSAGAALAGGEAEASFFVRDPETGVTLKARMDKLHASSTIDLKSFSNSRGKATDRAVNEAIYYEGYYQQAVFYHRVREIARRQLLSGEIEAHGDVPAEWLESFVRNDCHAFGFVFVESAEPFDIRVVQLARSEAAGGQANVYWNAAEIRIEDLTRLYAECTEKFGDRPWREHASPRLLLDSDLPQLMFA